jgi:superfamily II DNA or RNA helicase
MAPGDRAQHLVDLTSVEDDGLGEELSVVWEIEPGAKVLASETFPVPARGRFDEPDRLGAFLDAVRWGAVTSADSRALQAPFRSGIILEDYQLDPVVRALSMPRVNLLIADDVGLGKTIEAGLVLQEMLLRHRARTVVIVCPASLCLKWQAEMAQKFGLEFRIVDAELVRRLRRERGLAANVWRHFPRLIVSIDWLKRPRAMSLFRDILPTNSRAYPRTFDMLIIDEVHTVAPAGRAHYAVDSQRTRTIRELAPHFEHHLYLSATPHNGYRESWTALLELLDPQRFARGVEPAEEAKRKVMVRRLKSELRADPELRRPDGSPIFADRCIDPLEVGYTDAEREVHGMLIRYLDLRRRRSGTDPTSKQALDFIGLLLKKRLFSSPAGFAETLAVHRQTLAAKTERTTTKALRSALDRLDEEIADEDELRESTAEALATAAGALAGIAAEEKQLLTAMETWADGARHRDDSKAKRLLDFLDEVCRPLVDGTRKWNDERVIVFTEYRDTQLYLYERLAAHFPEGDVKNRVELLYGGMDTDRRERIKAEFQAHPSRRPVRILLATDAASEGIDLQLYCSRLVHYETPFSPARMEQRNGRIDRHGQTAPLVRIYHFVGAGWREAPPGSMADDLGFLVKLAEKLERVREDLGSVGPLLADQVQRRMLGDRRANLEVELPASRRGAARVLRMERNLRQEVQKLGQAVRESREELGITPEAVERVVRAALKEARQPGMTGAKLKRASGDPRPTGPAFKVGSLTGTWARTVMDLPDLLSHEVRPITFDHSVAREADDVVLAHLNHPLVAASCRLLRAAIWDSASTGSGLSRVTARVVPDAELGELVIVVHARLVVTGTGGHRLHEEVIFAGGRVAGGRFSREGWGVEGLRRALGVASSELPPDPVLDALAETWPEFQEAISDALRVRADDRIRSLERRIDEQAETDLTAIRTVLEELRRSILTELDRLNEPAQLTLGFDDDEKEQFRRDADALRARVEAIPAEILAEEEAVRRRYAQRSARVFPASITFLVPRRLCVHGIGDIVRSTRAGRSGGPR